MRLRDGFVCLFVRLFPLYDCAVCVCGVLGVALLRARSVCCVSMFVLIPCLIGHLVVSLSVCVRMYVGVWLCVDMSVVLLVCLCFC